MLHFKTEVQNTQSLYGDLVKYLDVKDDHGHSYDDGITKLKQS